MQFNLTTDYAIRTVLYLAVTDEITSSAQISKAMCISQKYIVNTIHKLKKAEIIESYPGINGGYKLQRAAEDISMYDIVFAMEGTIKINRCLEEDEYCNRFATRSCPVRKFYVTIQEDVEQRFKNTSVAKLLTDL